MIRDLRSAVAQCNDAGRVWKGEERFDVQLVHDDRLEY
jgi:ferric-chelate reductase